MRTALLIPNNRLAAEIRLRLGEERGFEEVATIESLPGAERIATVAGRLEADALFVEVTPDGGAALLRALRLAAPDLFLVACAETLDCATAVEWLRTGASDCFYRGMPDADLRAMLARLRESVAAAGAKSSRKEGQVAGFVSLKPGAGASTLTEQVGYLLQKQGKRVLLVDLNLAGGTTASWADGPEQPDVLQALANPRELDSEMAWRARTAWRSGMRVLPAPLVPDDQGTDLWDGRWEELLKMARRQFDWILVDLPPAAGQGTARLAANLDCVVAVATPDLACLHLASQRLQEMAAEGIHEEKLRVVLNRTTDRDLIGWDRVGELFGHGLFAALPEDGAALSAVGRGGLPNGSPLAGALRRLADALSAPAQPCRVLDTPPAAFELELAIAG